MQKPVGRHNLMEIHKYCFRPNDVAVGLRFFSFFFISSVIHIVRLMAGMNYKTFKN